LILSDFIDVDCDTFDRGGDFGAILVGDFDTILVGDFGTCLDT
jgi:hypothetical protein